MPARIAEKKIRTITSSVWDVGLICHVQNKTHQNLLRPQHRRQGYQLSRHLIQPWPRQLWTHPLQNNLHRNLSQSQNPLQKRPQSQSRYQSQNQNPLQKRPQSRNQSQSQNQSRSQL